MAQMRKFSLIAVTFLLSISSIRSARAAEPPADLCSLLSATEVSKILGQTYSAPQKSVAPRPYANTAEGTDCNYMSKNGKLWFRAYVDPSASASSELFTKLKLFYSPPTPVAGIGDEAYFDPQHAIHVRKGKVRYYLNLSPINSFTPAIEKQIKDLASRVAGQL
jgi:hypothetical protein